ncbi:MAG: hypothetical protein L0214_07620 [candidate division NC10 bacterium]|nr:hypothetical protein [candidate division NC10 bacterium]
MRVHLITIGTSIADDLDVATMLREDGHALVGEPEGAEVVAVWKPGLTPLVVVGPHDSTHRTYSLHGLRVRLKNIEGGHSC